MVADGLTKGSVERDPIVLLYSKNTWKGIGDQPVSVSLVHGGRKLPDRDGQKLSDTGVEEIDLVFPVTIYLNWTTIRC